MGASFSSQGRCQALHKKGCWAYAEREDCILKILAIETEAGQRPGLGVEGKMLKGVLKIHLCKEGDAGQSTHLDCLG